MALRSLAGKMRGFLPRRAAALDLKAPQSTGARDTVKETIEHSRVMDYVLPIGAYVLCVGTTFVLMDSSLSRIRERETDIPESIQRMLKLKDETVEMLEKVSNLESEIQRKYEAASGDPDKLKAWGESTLYIIQKFEDLQKRKVQKMPSDVLSILKDYEELEKAKGSAD